MNSELKKFLTTCLLAILTLLIPSFFGSNSFMSVALLSVVGILMLCVDWNLKHLIYYVAVFISGPLAESLAIHFGAWTYTQPIFIGVPIWLPFVWGNAGLYVLRLKSFIDSAFVWLKLSK